MKILRIRSSIIQTLRLREPRLDRRRSRNEHRKEMWESRLFETSFKEDRLKSHQAAGVEMLLLWKIYNVWNQCLNWDWKVHHEYKVILWGNSLIASRENFTEVRVWNLPRRDDQLWFEEWKVQWEEFWSCNSEE